MASRRVSVFLVVALLSQALSVPVDVLRVPRGFADNELDSKENIAPGPLGHDSIPAASEKRPTRNDDFDDDEGPSKVSLDSTTEKVEYATPVFEDDDSDEDDDFEPMNTAPAGGGSNIFSLLRLANALFPSSSSSGANPLISNLIRGYFNHQLYPNFPQQLYPNVFLRRSDVSENLINIDSIEGLNPPPFERQESDEDHDDSNGSDNDNGSESIEDDNNAAEESIEVNGNGNGNAKSQESNGNNSEDDYSDEPEGDGQGGGILGILAGLSGGEDGQSDLGSLLATISGIVGNLSGDGFDLNALIGSGIGLFVGLLSEGAENPGAVIASYLLTSVDTITGGGSKNNGAFFGTFLSKLINGISAGGDPDASSEEGKEPEKDSAGFYGSFLMALLGEMSKGSFGGSSGSSSHHPAEERSLQDIKTFWK